MSKFGNPNENRKRRRFESEKTIDDRKGKSGKVKKGSKVVLNQSH